MGNLKGRVERLEGGRKGRGLPIIIVHPGETAEEAWQKHLAQHPESEKAKGRINIRVQAKVPQAPPTPKAGTER